MNEFQPLPPKALTVLRIRLLLTAGFVAVVLLAFGVVAAVVGAAVLAIISFVVAAAMVVATWIFSGLVFRSYGWMLTEGTVELRHGVIVKRHLVLPRARVQNVTQSAGPVARSMGLATVTVHSAGANTPNITVPDVTSEVGEWLLGALLPSVRA